ncbi:MAG: ABC transporter permease [Chloroflexi bacterium]|nr:ABC transporter permease [Chloroflexota bacterium]
MRKILAIIWQALSIAYSDRNLLLIMLATPLALATIIGLAFGGTGSGDISIENIKIAIVNLDGVDENGANGQVFVDLLVPPAESAANSNANADTAATETSDDGGVVCGQTPDEDSSGRNVLFDLTDAVEMTDAAAARAAVDTGDLVAAIIIPADFSENLAYTQDDSTLDPTSIEVYGSSAALISSSVIRSITESIAYQIATGNIAIAATFDTLIERAFARPAFGLQFQSAAASFQPDFSCAFVPSFNPLRLEAQTVSGARVEFDPLVIFGASQAMFFMLFTAQGVATNVLEEQRTGTLQRLLVSPTTRLTVLIGKLLAAFINSLVQITLLFFAFSIVASLMRGEIRLIWGTHLPLVALTMIVASLSVAGLGVLLASLVRTPESAGTIGSMINMAMGVLGGAFFNVQAIPLLQPLTAFSLIYWGTDAFTKLSQGFTDIGLNLLILLVQGSVMFVAGLWLFNRRLKV